MGTLGMDLKWRCTKSVYMGGLAIVVLGEGAGNFGGAKDSRVFVPKSLERVCQQPPTCKHAQRREPHHVSNEYGAAAQSVADGRAGEAGAVHHPYTAG
jgi:hypothetical protein